MANFLVGEVGILTAHNTHSVNDRYEVFYDPTFFIFQVEKNGSVVTSGSGIFENAQPLTIYTQRSDTGFTFADAFNRRAVFDRINAFPYYVVRHTDIIVSGVNDIKLQIVRVTNESYPGAGDGSIEVSATGTNTPYSYSKDGSTFQTSTTFSGLYASTYVISARDSLGNQDYQTIVIDNTALSEADLAVKYRGDFRSAIASGDEVNVRWRIDIKLAGYVGAIDDTIILGVDPVIISARAEGSQPGVDVSIISHSATVTLLSETAKQYHEFATAGEYQYQVLVYRDESVAKDGTDYKLRFKGFITPDTFTEDFGNAPYICSFTANDRLGDLQSVEYRPGLGVLSVRQGEYRGLASQLSIIQKALETVAPLYPFRIAVDLYEDSMSQTNTSPLHQAYILQEVYYSKGNAKNCANVIQDILRPYGAVLFLWKGYYHIIKEEQFKQTSIAFNEFGTDLAYDTNGTIAGRIQFKAAGNTTHYRWAGSQSLNFTRPVYTINIKADGYIREGGVMDALDSPIPLNPFQFDFGIGNSSTISGFRGYDLVVGNNIYQSYSQGGWKFNMVDETPSATYIRKTGLIEYTSVDEFELQFKALVKFNIGGIYIGFSAGSPAAYLVLKWQFKLGTKYLQVDGTWTTSAMTNQFFIEKDQVDKFVDFKVSGLFPDGVVSATEQDYEFKLYPVSAWEYDEEYANKAAMLADMKTLADDTGYTAGSRRICRVPGTGSYYFYYYYEFRIDEEAANDGIYSIKATTSSQRRWHLVGSWWEQVDSGAGILAGNTITIFKDLRLDTLPSGDDPPNDFELITKINTVRNATNLDITLFHFDLQNSLNNEENIYLNYIRKSDGSPTSTWTRLGGTTEQTIQEHLRDRLYELYKTPRYKMSAKFYTDVEVSILNHLYSASDAGRIFILNGIEINPKTGLHSGEILEIYQDNTPIASAFDSGFDTGFS